MFGRYNDVLAYPIYHASYSVSVRQYRLLPFGFLQCIPHGKPPCHLLMLQDVTPAHKGLTPSGKIELHSLTLEKFICIFGIFPELQDGCVLLMLGTHTQYKKLGGKW